MTDEECKFPGHKNRGGYVRGCRCEDCRAENTEYMRQLRKR